MIKCGMCNGEGIISNESYSETCEWCEGRGQISKATRREIEGAMEHSVRDMEGFVKFVEEEENKERKLNEDRG